MATGYERRDVIQDPNSQSRVQVDSVPLAPVQSPRPSSFSRVGDKEKELASILGEANIGFQKYIAKKTDQWKLEGQMMYAEGKTEQEVVSQGNRYTTAGFMTMKARTAANEWEQQALNDIANGDYQMDSPAYQQKLMGLFKNMTDNVAGSDEFTRGLMSSIAENTFPNLVAQQVKANNAYKKNETANSYTSMLVSEIGKVNPDDPDSTNGLQELLDYDGGLDPLSHRAAAASAINMALDSDDANAKAAVYMLGGQTLGARNKNPGNIRDTATGEFKKFDTLEQGTLAMQQDLTVKVSGKSAMMKSKFGDNYSPTVANVISTWAPESENDTANYIKFVTQQTGFSADHVLTEQDLGKLIPAMVTMESGKETANITAALLQKGFDPAQVTSLTSSLKQYTSRQGDKFDQNRLLMEKGIIDSVEKDGNLPAALNRIAMAKAQYGYDDSWANSLGGRAVTAANTFEANGQKALLRQQAIKSGSLNQIDASEGQKALDEERARATGIVASQSSLSDQQKVDLVDDRMVELSAENNIVDKTMQRQIQMALSGDVVDKNTGKVKDDAVHAYRLFTKLYTQGGYNLAADYAGDAKDFLYEAMQFDTGADSIPTALASAKQVMANREAGMKTPEVKSDGIQQAVNKFADKIDVGFWESILPTGTFNKNLGAVGVLNTLRPTDAAIDNLKNSSFLRNRIQTRATALKEANPLRSDKSVVQEAAEREMANTELVGESVLFGSRDQTIRERIGVSSTAPNLIDVTVKQILADQGPKQWAEYENAKSKGILPKLKLPAIGAVVGGAGGALAGGVGAVPGAVAGGNLGLVAQVGLDSMEPEVPPFVAHYNPDAGTISIDLLVDGPKEGFFDKAEKRPTGKPIVIPANVLKRQAQKVLETY